VTGPRAIAAWSSGKDAAFALHEALRETEVVGILTTVTSPFERVSMHGVREQILDMQAASLGLALHKVRIPFPCPDEVYEREMRASLDRFRAEGVTHVVFGDLFLEDVRAYRERNLARASMGGLFPLWGRDTSELARAMLEAGIEARVTCVDPSKLDPSFAGRAWDRGFVDSLPPGVDPCGENGEFHTLVTSGPMFERPILVEPGEVTERDGFVFADMVPVRG
jgi:uncharacterized protein (TIGR00290 family)